MSVRIISVSVHGHLDEQVQLGARKTMSGGEQTGATRSGYDNLVCLQYLMTFQHCSGIKNLLGRELIPGAGRKAKSMRVA